MAFDGRRLLHRLLQGAGDEDGDSGEEDALLEYEGGNSSSSEEEEEEGGEGGGEREGGEGDEGAGEETKQKNGEFDRSLPAQHLYLGELETERDVAKMVDEEAMPILPLLCIPDRVLFPGETLPMHIYNRQLVLALRNASSSQKPVAIVTDRRPQQSYLQRPKQDDLAGFGTTAEVLAFREEEISEEMFYGPHFVVKFLGRQRFRLMEVFHRTTGMMDACVQILPEMYLPPRPTHLFSCPEHIYASYQATMLAARQPECTIQTCVQVEQCRKRLQSPRLSATLCQVPHWAFNRYDTDLLREQLMQEKEMKTFTVEEAGSHLPEDVTSLSYWLARRLPISDASKLQLLSIHCPTQRLLQGLRILQEFTDLCCLECETLITKKEDIFSMSVDGPLASYVNPGGYVHDTLTVSHTTNLRKQGRSCSEHSWFPGYSWTIINCKRCGRHKGWLFEATKKSLKPAKFFGLTRASLVLKSS